MPRQKLLCFSSILLDILLFVEYYAYIDNYSTLKPEIKEMSNVVVGTGAATPCPNLYTEVRYF